MAVCKVKLCHGNDRVPLWQGTDDGNQWAERKRVTPSGLTWQLWVESGGQPEADRR